LIKGRLLLAGALHFLFHAEGRVAPKRRSTLVARETTCRAAAARYLVALDDSMVWARGRVTPGQR